jgi:hypothetical protein
VVTEAELAEAPPADAVYERMEPPVAAELGDEDEIKPEPEIGEEEFEKVLEGLDVQDKMMGDA